MLTDVMRIVYTQLHMAYASMNFQRNQIAILLQAISIRVRLHELS